MALSADEQRALAEIERRLATDDPGLATCLTAFRRPGPARVLRSPRARIIGSLFTVLLVAMVSLMVYAMIPFRTHSGRPPAPPSAGTQGNVSVAATGTGGQPQSTPPASASTGASATGTGSSTARSAAPSAGQNAGTGQAKPTGNQAADQVVSPATGP
jgi:Protein of unknown function (DUF3040)